MIAALLTFSALAAEPPPLPVRSAPYEFECAEARAVEAGTPLGEVFHDTTWSVEDGPVFACGGILVPPSYMEYLLQAETHALSVSRLYKKDTELLQDRILKLQQPVPWIKTPTGQRWLGRAEILAIVGTGIVTAVVLTK